jgi:hypothetical protein
VALACAGAPVLAVKTWTRAADHAKSRSILGRSVTSKSLKSWNFGTLQQRLSAETWSVFSNRTDLPLGGKTAFAIAALGLVMARRRIVEIAGCLLLYLVSILTFTNLYFVHDYYYFANNIFLIVAVGLVIVAMIEDGGRLRDGAIAAIALLLGSMGYDYSQTYRPIQAHNEMGRQRLGVAIRDQTAPGDTVVLLGFDWSSEVPYYSERRTLCLTNWAKPGRARASLKALASSRIGAVAVLPSAQTPIPREELLAIVKQQGFDPVPATVDAPFELLVRADRATGPAVRCFRRAPGPWRLF